MNGRIPLVACGVCLLTAPAMAQVLQFDVNTISYTILDSSGSPGAFGGESHTGAVQLSLGIGRLPAVLIQDNPPSGPFELQPGFTGTLTGFDARLNLDNGEVTGGSLRLEVDSGDVYEADIDAIGSVEELLSGGFTIDYGTSGGSFSDLDFAGVNVSRWSGSDLPGLGLLFRFNPTSPMGTADTDIFVIPGPAPLALLGLAGIAVARRRR